MPELERRQEGRHCEFVEWGYFTGNEEPYKFMRDENKIYLGNLEYGVTDTDLRSLIEAKGFNATEVTVIKDKATDRSKGFGFAKFATAEEMEQAIQALNGLEVKSRALRVSKALKKTEGKNSNFNRPAYSSVDNNY